MGKVVALLFVIFACSVHGGCEIIAHRGASNRTPENTVLAVQAAWELGADSVEVDLRLSADDQIVIYHDKDTARIGGRRRPVVRQTLAELQELDVGSHRGGRFSGLRVPTLQEVIATVPQGGRLFLEIKVGAHILPILEEVIQGGDLANDQLRIIGFDYDTMVAAKAMFPDLEVYWLLGISQHRDHDEWPKAIDDVLGAAERGKLDGLCVEGNAVVGRRFVGLAQEQDLKFFVYTINSKTKAQRFKKMGVDGIITDRPKYIRDNL